jgi:hypothetical protein
MQHTVVLGQTVPGEKASPRVGVPKEGDGFEAFGAMEEVERQQEMSDSEVVLGKLYDLYRASCAGEIFVAPAGSGNHVCTFKCTLVNVTGHKYKVEGHPHRWHVCLARAGCRAPEWMHSGTAHPVGNTLFVCKETMCVHICDKEHCNAEKATTSDSICCSATGRVLHANPAQLSHGWIEDDWRHHVPHESTRRKKKQQRQACGGSYQYKECTNTLATMRRAGGQPCYNIGFERRAMEEHIQEVYAFAHAKLRQLLPGSPQWVAATTKHAHTARAQRLGVVEKLLRRLQKRSDIDFHALSSAMAAATVQGHSACHADPERMDGVARAYSAAVVDYIRKLSTHTGLEQQEVTLADLVCAMAYLLRESFILDDCALITPDVLMLHYLPPANSLAEYGYKKNNFTTTKTAIKTEIVKCVKMGGVAPWRLVFHPVPLAKILTPQV